MVEYFAGWRRKIGMVTLPMACLLMCLWMRGVAIEDAFRLGNGQGMATRGKVLHTLSTSYRNGFVWTREEAVRQPFAWRAGWQSHPTEKSVSFDPLECSINCSIIDWRWQLCGLDFGRYHAPNNDRLVFCHISYLSIVIPLTVISLWLLLAKSLPSTQKKIIEPIQDERGVTS